MTPELKRRIQEAGLTGGDPKDLLGLSPAEVELVALRVELAKAFRKIRKDAGITQVELAAMIGSSQSRIASAENGVHASLDLLIRCLYAVGGKIEPIFPKGKLPPAKLGKLEAVSSKRKF